MNNQFLVTGSDIISARRKFLDIKKSFNGANFVEVDLSSITSVELAEKLQLNDMFSQTVFVFVNFSLTNAQTWDVVDKYLNEKPAIFEAVGKKIGRIPAKIKKKLQIASIDNRTEIFNLLSAVTPAQKQTFQKLLDRNLSDTPEQVVMVMIQNRIRDMIVVLTSPESFKGQDWQRTQMSSQAKAFGLTQLIKLYRRLLTIEIREKSSLNPDSSSQHFMVELFSV